MSKQTVYTCVLGGTDDAATGEPQSEDVKEERTSPRQTSPVTGIPLCVYLSF